MYQYGGYLPSNVTDQAPIRNATTDATGVVTVSSGALQGPRVAGATLLSVLTLVLGAGFWGIL